MPPPSAGAIATALRNIQGAIDSAPLPKGGPTATQPQPPISGGAGTPGPASSFTPTAWTPPREMTMAMQDKQWTPPDMAAYKPSSGFTSRGLPIGSEEDKMRAYREANPTGGDWFDMQDWVQKNYHP